MKYMEKNKDINICPKCFSKNVSYDKCFLPGGVEEYDKLKKEKEGKT